MRCTSFHERSTDCILRDIVLTYVDFTVVLPCKIFFLATAANGCVTDLEDKTAGKDDNDHDENGAVGICHPDTAAAAAKKGMIWVCNHFAQ